MLIDAAELWAAATNGYVVARDRGEPALLIDAPPDIEGLADLVKRHDIVPVALLATHGHIDHIGGAGSAATRFSLTAYLHPDDDWLAGSPEDQLRSMFGMIPPGDFAPPERYEALAHGQGARPRRPPDAGASHTWPHTGALLFPPRVRGLAVSVAISCSQVRSAGPTCRAETTAR